MANSPVNVGAIGYYVHHHGTGHMRRAMAICRHMSRPVVVFSSLPKPLKLPANVTFVQLHSDAVKGYTQPESSSFHYTPNSPQVFARNQQLIDAWRTFNITNMYVDVSIEVALLAKLYGLRVGHAVMLGDRTDTAHRFGYDAVDYLLAHYAPQLDEPVSHMSQTEVQYSGGISRFKKRPVPPPSDTAYITTDQNMPRTVTVTCSPKHERDITEAIIKSAQHFTNTTWHVIGQKLQTDLKNVISHGVVENPEAIYEQSDVIIGSGGMNTIMEVASMAKHFICIPEARPFNEQQAAAIKLEQLQAAVYAQAFPEPAAWPGLCQRLAKLDIAVFASLVDDDAAKRAAHIIETAGATAHPTFGP